MTGSYNVSKIRFQIQKLERFCSINSDPAIRGTTLDRNQALKCLNKIVKNSQHSSLQSIPGINSLIRCSLVLIQACAANIEIPHSFFHVPFSTTPFERAKALFICLMQKFVPDKLTAVVETIMEFLKIERLWKVEYICCEIFGALLLCQTPCETIADSLISYIEEMIVTDEIEESRHVISVFHSIIKEEYFSSMPAATVKRLLTLYHLSVGINESDFYLVRMGFEGVLIKILKVLSENEAAKILSVYMSLTFDGGLKTFELKDFGLTICHGVSRIRLPLKNETFFSESFKFLIQTMMAEPCEVKSFLATRFLTLLIDRFNNFDFFSTPMIFHEVTNYGKIKVALSEEKDAIDTLEVYRDIIEIAVIQQIKFHCSRRDNLCGIYALLCTLIVTFPSGFTITLVAGILMKVQNKTESQDSNQTNMNHLHAIIASIMTLISWVTKATSLSKYVHNIVNLRYDSAPHMNPPLIGENKVQHIKRELFFEPWELRYCFWKYFRLDEDTLPLSLSRKFKKSQTAKRRQTLSYNFIERNNEL